METPDLYTAVSHVLGDVSDLTTLYGVRQEAVEPIIDKLLAILTTIHDAGSPVVTTEEYPACNDYLTEGTDT